jgi:hypothetical protein
LPSGVTFTSASGVLLTGAGSVAETLTLLGFAGLSRLAENRRGR